MSYDLASAVEERPLPCILLSHTQVTSASSSFRGGLLHSTCHWQEQQKIEATRNLIHTHTVLIPHVKLEPSPFGAPQGCVYARRGGTWGRAGRCAASLDCLPVAANEM